MKEGESGSARTRVVGEVQGNSLEERRGYVDMIWREAVVFHNLHIGLRNTRLCPYLVMFTMLSYL